MISIVQLSISLVCRCYTAGGKSGTKSQAELVEEERQAALKELEPLKLPGKMAEYTGNVMYPNEESAVWDVNGECWRREGEVGPSLFRWST